MNLATTSEAANILRLGGVIAYPTESCYGLGCDPKNHQAIRRLLQIKRRSHRKGLILISDHLSRLKCFVNNIPPEKYKEILDSWPGPTTWLLPARKRVSYWLRGSHDSIGVRITAHRHSIALCRAAGMAVVSTSANRSGCAVLRSASSVFYEFGDDVDCVLEGSIGADKSPSVICDGTTGEVIRRKFEKIRS